MTYLKLIMPILSLAGIGYIVFVFVEGYLGASGTRWTRVMISFHNSMTILWARFVVVVGLVVNFLVAGADYFNLPGVSEALMNYLTPATVSIVMVGIMIISELARRRTL